MNWHDPQSDSLDDLLQKARWPDAQPEQLQRLERGWKRTVRRRKVRRVACAAAVILAPIICLVGVLTIQHNRRPVEQQIVEQPKPAPSAIVEHQPETPKTAPEVVSPSDPPEIASQIVREPNAYERAVAVVHRRHIAAAKVATKQAPKPALEVDNIAIQRLSDDPKLDAAVVAQSITATVHDGESRLRRWLQTSAGNQVDTAESLVPKRQAALRLLGVLATQESAPLLLAVLRNADCPNEIVQAVARLSTPEQLAARARSEPSAERQQQWLVAIFERGSPQAVAEYLNLANHPAMATAALAAVSSAKNPPIDALFSTMQTPRVQMRITAARILGSLNQPAVSKRLAELAMQPATRREALIGLMCSTDSVAKQFLRDAQDDLTLASSVRAISNRYSLVQSVN